MKDVRKILQNFDPLPHCRFLDNDNNKSLLPDIWHPHSTSNSIRQNFYCVVNVLQDSGHKISHIVDEWGNEIWEVENYQFMLFGVKILTVIEQLNT